MASVGIGGEPVTEQENTAGVRRRLVTTTDVDEATELLRSWYADHQPVFSGDRESFRFELSSTGVDSDAGWFQIDRVGHNMRVSAPTEPARELLLTVPLSGRLHHRVGRETTASACLIPYWQPCLTEWDELDAAIGLFDLGSVRRIGAELSGLPPSEVQFVGWTPLSPAWADLVVATLGHVRRRMLAHTETAQSPLLRAEAFRHLATTLLAAFPNTTQTLTAPGRDRAGPATVRRAMAFMDVRAREDIDLTRIAEASGIGARGLQSAFRQHRRQTPLEYLRRVRLEGAHRELRAADPTQGATVAEIAASWGFHHAGRFSVEYRRVFGHTPSQTLRE